MTRLSDFRAEMASLPGAVTVFFDGYSSPGLLDFEGFGWGVEGQSKVGVEDIALTYVYPDLPGLSVEARITIVDAEAISTVYIASTEPRRKTDGLEAVVTMELA